MSDAAAPGGTDTLGRFRTLTTATILATLALIVIGGIVRVSDSGLGCGQAGSGTHGWPLCTGSVLPSFVEGETAVEFTHRVAAAIVGILIALMAYVAHRRLETPKGSFLRRSTGAALGLVLVQAALGGLTVEKDLHEVLVAAHLLLAMLLLGLLLWIRSATAEPARAQAGETQAARGRPPARLAALAALTVLATIVAGGYVAGTEGEGKADEPVLGAHLACGQEFPGCLDGFMPFGEYGDLVDAQLTHRALMYLAALAVLALAFVSIRRRVPSPLPLIVVGAIAAQILLGAINVWEGKHAGLIVSHLTLGTIVWALLAQTWIEFTKANR